VSTSHEVSANPTLTNCHYHGVRRRADVLGAGQPGVVSEGRVVVTDP
jgi:hypothetical protein